MAGQVLTIRGWAFNLRELAALPPFVIPAVRSPAARMILEDGGNLAAAYHAAGESCKDLAEGLGVSYRLARNALAWYGIWPAEPRPAWYGMNGKEYQEAGPPAPDPEPEPEPEPPPYRDRIAEIVTRAYLKADRCPPDCAGRDQCLGPGGACIWYKEGGGNGDPN